MADGNAPRRIFLRKILYRIDYQLLTEKTFEGTFEFISERFGKYFATKNQEVLNAIGVEINSDQLEQSRFSNKAQTVFTFSMPQSEEDDGRVLRVGRTFTFLEVSLNLETTGISYYEWISDIVKFISTNETMFKLSRIGLRKFNKFYILDEDKDLLDSIFAINYLCNNTPDGFTLDNFKDAQIYNTKEYKFSFIKEFSSGNLSNNEMKIDNKPAHLISFDFDLFSTCENDLTSFLEDSMHKLVEMNSVIFKFFESIIQPDIKQKIIQGDLLEEYRIIPF